MAKKDPVLTPELQDAIWAAGVVSMSGSMTLVSTRTSKVVRFVMTTKLYPEALQKISDMTGTKIFPVKVGEDNTSYRLALQGAALHKFFSSIWNYLSLERKKQYAAFRKQITATAEGNNPYRDNDMDEYEADDE